MADWTVVEAVWRWLNTWPQKAVHIGLDALEKTAPSMMVQPLSGTVVQREYINRSFLGSWPFAVYVRANAGDNADRVDAFGMLMALWEWMRAGPLPDIGERKTPMKIEMTSLPSLMMRYEDGSEDYQAVFALTYREGN